MKTFVRRLGAEVRKMLFLNSNRDKVLKNKFLYSGRFGPQFVVESVAVLADDKSVNLEEEFLIKLSRWSL